MALLYNICQMSEVFDYYDVDELIEGSAKNSAGLVKRNRISDFLLASGAVGSFLALGLISMADTDALEQGLQGVELRLTESVQMESEIIEQSLNNVLAVDVSFFCSFHDDAETEVVGSDGRIYEVLALFRSPVRAIMSEPSLCQSLVEYRQASSAGEASPDQALVAASVVFIISHETAHAEGITDEGNANCRGVELSSEVAGLMGFSGLVDVNYLSLAQNMEMPPEYHEAGC